MKNLSQINATDLRDFLKGNGWNVNGGAILGHGSGGVVLSRAA